MDRNPTTAPSRPLGRSPRRRRAHGLLLALAATGLLACVGGSSASSGEVETSTADRHAKLRDGLKVVASRNNAYYGFNTPELQLHLPLEDEARYAEIEMHPPRLFGADGEEVAYQLERGLHDVETQIAEIRFLDEDGERPAEFARAVGEIDLSYPTVLETRELTPGDADDAIRVTASSVEILEGTLPEAPPLSEVAPLRVFDGAGRLLDSTGRSTTIDESERTWTALAFDGNVARVEVDLVSRRARIRIEYDVPIAAALPEGGQGVPVDDPRAVDQDPESRVSIEIEEASAPSGAVSADAQATEEETAPSGATRTRPRAEKESVAIRRADELSASSGQVAEALAEIVDRLGEPPSIVQAMVMPPAFVSLSVAGGQGVVEYRWEDGGVAGPSSVDTRWLQCTDGLPAGAFTLERIPTLLDDAAGRVDGGRPLQLVVGQGPCGVASTTVSFDGGAWVTYEADGRFVEAATP